MRKTIILLVFLLVTHYLYPAGTPEKVDFAWGITYRETGGGQKFLPPGEQELDLTGGGELGIYLVPLNNQTYIYILHFDRSGNFNLLYPARLEGKAFREQHESLWKIKPRGEMESIYLLCSNRRLQDLEKLVKSLEGKNNEEFIYKLLNLADLFLKERLSLYEVIPAPEFFGGVFRGEGTMSRVKDVESYGHKIKIRH